MTVFRRISGSFLFTLKAFILYTLWTMGSFTPPNSGYSSFEYLAFFWLLLTMISSLGMVMDVRKYWFNGLSILFFMIILIVGSFINPTNLDVSTISGIEIYYFALIFFGPIVDCSDYFVQLKLNFFDKAEADLKKSEEERRLHQAEFQVILDQIDEKLDRIEQRSAPDA